MRRIVVCGEALIDLVPVTAPTDPRASDWRALSAGGPLNTAIGLARLGVAVEFLGRLGSDSFAAQLRSHLVTSGVGTSLVVDADQPTSLAIVSLDDQGKASYTFHFADTANFGWRANELPRLGSDEWLHIGSILTVVGPGNVPLVEWARAGTGPMSLDINVRPTVQPDMAAYWSIVDGWLKAAGARAGLVKGSDEDFDHLAAHSGLPSDPEELAVALRDRYGVRWAVVTRGADGAVGAGPDGVASVASPPVTLVDTIGAGDTFMAGLIDGLVVRDLTLVEALRRGAKAAALVCEREGADPPTAAQVDADQR